MPDTVGEALVRMSDFASLALLSERTGLAWTDDEKRKNGFVQCVAQTCQEDDGENGSLRGKQEKQERTRIYFEPCFSKPAKR